jgi:copper chaperone CopZ
MEILVFKTNIRYKKNISTVTPHLQNVAGVKEWNVDLKDRDKILRITALNVVPASIENLVKAAGYYCEELKD